ncbi:nitroreductase family protein [bacterium]
MDFLELAEKRYSLRNFSNKKVEREKIEKCIQASHLSPSACNSQPWRFIIIDDKEIKNKLCEKGLGILVPNTFAKDAPCIIVVCADLSFMVHTVAAKTAGVNYYMLDIGASIENFLLEAADLGLGACWMGWFREKAIKKLLGIPKSLKIVSLIALGYSNAETDDIPLKNRKPLNEIFSYNKF